MKINDDGSALTATIGDLELFRYVYQPTTKPFECPCPYFHPLRTLAGQTVTAHRPNDHRWHKGLAMTASHVSGQNFWGGGSYVHGQGYVDLPNVGTLRHKDFPSLTDTGFTEHVDWITQSGEHWIAENRMVDVMSDDDAWLLEFTTELHNVRGEGLEFGSPTVFGRELAGYCGLFWRGPRAFTGGQVIAPDGQRGQEMMGRRAAWLAFVGEHDETDHFSTLVFAERDNEPYWFVRSTPFAAVNPSLAFHEALVLPAGEVLARRYRVVVADGGWDETRIADYLAERPW
jgi:hypothetical protein